MTLGWPSETGHGRGILSGVSTAPNKAIVMRHFAVLNGGDPADWDEIMAEDFVVHHPFASGSGRDRYRTSAAVYPTVFEGFTTDVHRLVAEDDIVVAYFTTHGRHTGDFLGYAATGREFAFTGMAMYRIADGQLAEAWYAEDTLGWFQQLGSPWRSVRFGACGTAELANGDRPARRG
jgi:steroid delta-isomerase-like uncharacterized protein